MLYFYVCYENHNSSGPYFMLLWGAYLLHNRLRVQYCDQVTGQWSLWCTLFPLAWKSSNKVVYIYVKKNYFRIFGLLFSDWHLAIN